MPKAEHQLVAEHESIQTEFSPGTWRQQRNVLMHVGTDAQPLIRVSINTNSSGLSFSYWRITILENNFHLLGVKFFFIVNVVKIEWSLFFLTSM